MSSCVFCAVIRGETWAAVVGEDEEHVAFMDNLPASIGHVLVVPKKHHETIFDMRADEVSKLYAFASEMAKAVKTAVVADGVSIVQNNGPTTGQKIPHVHVHIIPSSLDRPFVMKWQKIELGQRELEGIAAKIREEFARDERACPSRTK
jgi:histidine triad (HIT) family protein